jgi:hypothetical protein
MNFFRKKSVLRELVDPKLWAEDQAAALMDAAFVVRRAGLEHLVGEVTRAEALAMAVAGERIQKERAALLAGALSDPAEAVSAYDGGAMKRKQVMAEARASAKGGV